MLVRVCALRGVLGWRVHRMLLIARAAHALSGNSRRLQRRQNAKSAHLGSMQQYLDKLDATARHGVLRGDSAELLPPQLLRQLVRRAQWVNFSPTLAEAFATCVD